MSEMKKFVRFTKYELIQHILLFVTLFGLSITGLSLKYYDSSFGKFIIDLEGGFERRGKIHLFFSFLLIFIGILHAFYVTFSDRGQEQIRQLRFRVKDFKDFFMDVKLYLGFSKEQPRFNKFTYSQKFQYWGVIVGCFMMILTGLILFFKKAEIAMLVPKWLWDITFIFHGAEGLIIFIVLLVWHMYDVHLSPQYFPMQNTWLTGEVTEEEMKENYSLEYERLNNQEDIKK